VCFVYVRVLGITNFAVFEKKMQMQM
jgi:hypothetical protein